MKQKSLIRTNNIEGERKMNELELKYGCNPNQKPSKIYMENGELPITSGDNQRLRVIVPANFDGNISLFYSEPWYWRSSELLSLFTLFALIAFQLKKKPLTKKQRAMS